MKVQCPKGTTGVSIGGEEFTVDKKGRITLPEGGNHFSLLPPGFTALDEDGSAKDDDEAARLKAEAEAQAEADRIAAEEAAKTEGGAQQ